MTGLSVGLGLILAIGAQNAFILRQGLRGEHILAVPYLRAIRRGADRARRDELSENRHDLADDRPSHALRGRGLPHLVWSAQRLLGFALHRGAGRRRRRRSSCNPLAACLALTWLNPHVYLDTVVLLGTISTNFRANRQLLPSGQ
jgi:L-lysine exporter family protein LysE/ArgO